MKNLRILFFLMLSAGLFFIIGCTEEDDTDKAPTINFASGNGNVIENKTLLPGETFWVGINAFENSTSNKNLDRYTVTRSGTPAIAAATVINEAISGTSLSRVDTFIASTGEHTETWTFTVTDNAGESAFVSFIITTQNAATLLTEVNSAARLNNIIGPDQGAFDLVNNVNKGVADPAADKDMVNTTVIAPGAFAHEWTIGSGNTTNFVKATGFDYANATVESATAAYQAVPTKLTTVSNVATDDVYIANLRGAGNYAVIKITSIVDNGAASNVDYIEFKYKK